MKAVVIGLGSMGRRRIRLLSSIDKTIEVSGVDLSEERRIQAETELGIITYESLGDAIVAGGVDLAFVCTSPKTHATIVSECLNSGLHTFTELNLVKDRYKENMALAAEKGVTLFLSSTFLYRRETKRIAEEVSEATGSYSYHVGQYLPDWHPWESWRDFFVADSRTSGVREILAIELPWLQGAFGRIVRLSFATRRVTDIGLPYDDTVALLVEHEGGTIGTLMVDVVCRRAVRRFEYTDEERYLTWDGTPDTLKMLDITSGEMRTVDLYGSDGSEHREGYAAFIVEDAYRDELSAFLDTVMGKTTPAYGYKEDLETLLLIDQVEGRS